MQHAGSYAGRLAPRHLQVSHPADGYNAIEWHKSLGALFDLQSMSAEDYTRFMLNYEDNSIMSPSGQGNIASGINMQNFCKEVIVPFVVLHYGGVLNPRCRNNYAACQLLTIPIAPLESPANQVKFRYVIEKRELTVARRGDARMAQGNTKSTSLTFDATLIQHYHVIPILYEAIMRVDRRQVYAEMTKLVRENLMAWQASIAMFHYEYANAQPSFSTLVLQNKSRRAEYANRCRSGMVSDLVSIDNLLTGCLNRDLDMFTNLIASAVGMLPEIKQMVAIMPRGIMVENSSMFMVRVTIDPALMKFSIFETDEGYKKIDVDWSQNLLATTTSGDLDSRYHIELVSGPGLQAPNLSFKSLDDSDTAQSFLLPAVRIGEMVVPLILLDNEELCANGPAMDTSFITKGTKRHFFTVGAVTQTYRSLYCNQSFYRDGLEITTGTAAQKDPRISSIVNVEESASITDISLHTLHKQANIRSVFNLLNFTARLANMPELMLPIFYLREYQKMACDLLEARTTHLACLYEVSPRMMRTLSFHGVGTSIAPSYADAHRLCLWNAFQMSAPEGEYAALVSLLSFMGRNEELESFLSLVNNALGTVTPESVATLVLMRYLAEELHTREQFENWLDPTTNAAIALAFANAVGAMLTYIVSTTGNTLAMGDPICQVFFLRFVPFFNASCALAVKAAPTAGQTAALEMLPETGRLRLQEIYNVMYSGVAAFKRMVSKFPVGMICTYVQPFTLSAAAHLEEEQYVADFSNFAMPALVDRELRYIFVSGDQFSGKRAPGTQPRAPGRMRGSHGQAVPLLEGLRLELKSKFYRGEFAQLAGPTSELLQNFSILTGEEADGYGEYSFAGQNRKYENSFYCRSNKADLSEILTCTIRDLGMYDFTTLLDRKLTLDVTNLANPAVTANTPTTCQQFDQLAFADISHVRINMAFENILEKHKPTVIAANVQPFYSCLQPPLVLRLRTLRSIMGTMPLHAFYACMHYFSALTQENIVERFDLHYYSSLAYLCVRTMRYQGYNMTVMPVGDSIFVTGNRNVYNVRSDSVEHVVGTEMDMGIIPGRQASHGVHFPSVFMKEMRGMNVVFHDKDDNTSNRYALGRDRKKVDRTNCMLVLDWSNFLLPETTTACRTCPSVIPISGRYVNTTVHPNQGNPNAQGLRNMHLLEYDPLLKSHCICPTMLPHFSDSWMVLEDLKDTIQEKSSTAALFCMNAMFTSVEESLPGSKLPNNTRNAMLQNAIYKNICAPLTDSLALMFADTYTIGSGGAQFLRTPATEQKHKELTPRVEGEGMTPCHYHYVQDSPHFATKFNKLINLQLSTRTNTTSNPLGLASVSAP